MKRDLGLIFALIVAVASGLLVAQNAYAGENVIPDGALRDCIIDEMHNNYEYNVATPDVVTRDDIVGFIDHVHHHHAGGPHLHWACQGISSLEGLDMFFDIDPAIFASLMVENGTVSDVTPLAGIKQIAHLNLSGNLISDMFDISGIAGLTDLDLSNNQLSMVPGLQSTHLETLVLSYNQFDTLPSLSHMKDLFCLDLSHNHLTDVASLELAGLTNLVWADLSYNHISDASALAPLVGWINDVWPPQGDALLTRAPAVCGTKACAALSLDGNHITDMSAFPNNSDLRQAGGHGVMARNQTNYDTATLGVPVNLPAVQTTSANDMTWHVAPGDAVISNGQITYLHAGAVDVTWQDNSPHAVVNAGTVTNVLSDFTGTITVTVTQ